MTFMANGILLHFLSALLCSLERDKIISTIAAKKALQRRAGTTQAAAASEALVAARRLFP